MDKIKKLSQELFKQLGVKPKNISVADQTGTIMIDVGLDDQEAGVLIGYHGETIASLQLLLNLMVFRQTGEWQRVVINIGDYRQKRSEYLVSLAEDTADRVIESGEPMALYNLNPFERREVHTVLAKRGDVETASQGEGKHRFLVVSPKND